MNKYQKAFDYLASNGTHETLNYWGDMIEVETEHGEESLNLLRELVDKETPMKPTSRKVDFINWNHYCKCGEMLDSYRDYRCNECGQKLDWTEENND